MAKIQNPCTKFQTLSNHKFGLDVKKYQMKNNITIFGIWNLEFGIWNLEFGIWNLEFVNSGLSGLG